MRTLPSKPNGDVKRRDRAPGRPRGFDRDEALATAQRLFRQHGYEGVSIARLVGAIGIAPPSLYAAFGGKADLYREAISRYEESDGVEERIPEEGSAYERVAAALRRGVKVVTSDPGAPGCMISSGMLTAGPDNAALAAELRERRTGFRRKIETWLTEDVASGTLDADLDVGGLARFYSSVMQGLSVQALDGATAAELDAVVAASLRAWPGRRDG